MDNVQHTITNAATCPVCGSDMKREKSDSPHDRYTGHFTCQNRNCNVSTTIRN